MNRTMRKKCKRRISYRKVQAFFHEDSSPNFLVSEYELSQLRMELKIQLRHTAQQVKLMFDMNGLSSKQIYQRLSNEKLIISLFDQKNFQKIHKKEIFRILELNIQLMLITFFSKYDYISQSFYFLHLLKHDI